MHGADFDPRRDPAQGGPVAPVLMTEAVPPAPPAVAHAPPRRLRALLLTAVLLPMLALAAIAVDSWRAVEAEAHGRVSRAVAMLHEHALRAFEAQELAIAAAETRIRGMAWPELRASRDVFEFLRALDEVTPAAGGVALVAPSGQLALASTSSFPTPDVDLSGRDYVSAHPPGSGAREIPFIGEVVVARPSGMVVFPMARPRRRADGLGDGGVIIATLWPAYFESFYASIRETAGDAIMLFRLDGALLAAVPVPQQPEGAHLPASAGPMLRQLRGRAATVISGPSPIDGMPRITGVRRLAGYDVAVAYGLPITALTADWRRRMAGPVAGALLAMVLLLALTLQAERAIRAREAADARSRAAERQATLGLLAGGLAHDFGNITQSVMAAAILIGKHAEDAARVREIARHLQRHAERAAALSRRMLDTTRRSGRGAEEQAPPLDVSDSLRELAALLDATLGAGIRVRSEASPGLRAAPGVARAELETAVINLAANARDAMPEGGEIRLTGEPVVLAPALAAMLALPTGLYLRIAVADHGVGMDETTLARLGEPFFTTKPEGAGTGLGLAMVAAFVRAAGGAFRAESEPGRGTTISLYVPASPPAPAGRRGSGAPG
jgi:two-component system NtrC family sensor kinase